jgi:multiple sugar transport system permease protein
MTHRRYQRSLLLLLLPFLFGVTLLVLLPAALSLGLAFTQYDGLSMPMWVGWSNFQSLADDELFRIAVGNSLLFVALSVPVRTLLTFGLALLLARPRRGVGLYRAAVYLPTVVPGVAYALVWLWILNPLYGPLNLLLGQLGLPTPAWLVDPRTALLAIAITAVFQLGEGFVVLLAGLQEIPDEYYETAMLDGAGRLAMVRLIVLPLLAPWLLLIVLRDLIVSVQSSFTPVLLMTGGGPYYATLLVPLLIYQTAFERLRFGEGAAMTLLLFLGVGLLILLAYRLFGGWGYDEAV